MWVVIVTFVVLSSASCDQFLDQSLQSHLLWPKELDQICGESYTDRIIGGKDAELGQYPWIARLLISSKKLSC